jgi:hypothetical protein
MLTNYPDALSIALSLSCLGAHDMHMHAVASPGMLLTQEYQNHALDLRIKAQDDYRASSAGSFVMPVETNHAQASSLTSTMS